MRLILNKYIYAALGGSRANTKPKPTIAVMILVIAMALILILNLTSASAQNPSSSIDRQIAPRLMRLEQGKKLLYVSFLPGQENTKLLTKVREGNHFNTAVFWMTRGEGMQNYNGPEKGIDLGVIHVAEMENAAKAAGYRPYVSSCKDLGARDTGAINATLPTDRLILDLAAVIQQFRPDILIVGHCHKNKDSVPIKASQHIQAGFNEWMDSICQVASRLAADPQSSENKSFGAFAVKGIWADQTGAEQVIPGREEADVQSKAGDGLLAVKISGADPVLGKTYQEISLKSKQSFRSIYPDLDHIPLLGDTAWLQPLGQEGPAQTQLSDEAIVNLFREDGTAKTGKIPDFGVWPRLAAKDYPVDRLLAQLKDWRGLLQHRDNQGDHNDPDAQISPNYAVLTARLKAMSKLLHTNQNARDTAKDPDRRWLLDQIMDMRKALAGVDLLATSDQELGVLGQDFRLRVAIGQNACMDTSAKVLWLKTPGLIDTALRVGPTRYRAVLLDTTIHVPLMQEAYQPFWLNKSMRSDGSYNIDGGRQGQLSDTTSYHVVACVATKADTLLYKLPVFYRHFDRMEGQIERPFYTIEPVLVALTPTVLLTHVLRDHQDIRQKELQVKMKTLFKDSAQVILIKLRQVGIEATINGQKIQSDSASRIYEDAGYITPAPGAKTKIGIVLNRQLIQQFNPLTPVIKPSVLLKLPEGVQAFSSNIKSIGYPYQSPRIYNYHSQTLVVGDTIHTSGSHLLYLNGLSGDVFENAFNQLGYKVQTAGFNDFASWVTEVDLSSGLIPSFIKDSLQNLDAIVLSGTDKTLISDSLQLARLHYILDTYVKIGGRLINLDPDPALQKYLPVADSVNGSMLTAGNFREKAHIDSLAALLNMPNKVPLQFFHQWEGIVSMASIVAPTDKNSAIYPVGMTRLDPDHGMVAPLNVHYLNKGLLINCFLAMDGPLGDGKPAAYQLLANILACSAPKPGEVARKIR